MFIAPWLLGFVCLSIIPLVIGFLSSLTNYDGLSIANMRFVGTANYVRAFNDPDVGFSIKRTLIWGLVNVPLYLVISFSLALMLNQAIRGRGFFRTIFYLPSVVPLSAALIAWKVILDKNVGLLNGLIDQFRPGTAIGWLSNYALAGMAAISIWAGLGVGMVIFLAALQGIPDELTEAARIDGANSFQVLLHVILPLMTPVIFLQLVMGLISSFQQLNLPLLLTQVGLTSQGAVPPRPIYLYMIHTYEQIFTKRVYGYGNALLWMLFVTVLLLTGIVFWTQRYWVYTEQSGEGDSR
jgi:multiple sugar transport system permease protein